MEKDKWSDLAVVKATSSDSSVKEIAIGDSNNLVLGEPILVVGNPLGVDFKRHCDRRYYFRSEQKCSY